MGKRVDQAKRDLAERLGESEQAIRVSRPDWARLMGEGVCVDLHISRWRAEKRLSLSDLGIVARDAEEAKAYERYLALGYSRLAPSEIMEQLAAREQAARANLERHSFKTFWGRWIPVTAYQAWRAENDTCRTDYLAKGRELLARYSELAEETRAAYIVAGRAAWDRLAGMGRPMAEGREEYARLFADRIMALLPSQAEVEAALSYTWELRYIPLPSLLAADEADAGLRVAESQAERDRLAMLETMNADIVARARSEKESLVNGFFTDVEKQVRGYVYEIVTSALSACERNEGKLQGRTVVQLRNLIETVKGLVFWDSAELEAQMGRIRSLLDSKAADRSPDAIGKALREIATVSRYVLLDLGDRPRSARDLGVPDVPAAETVRQMRADTLGLDAPALAMDVAPRGRRASAA